MKNFEIFKIFTVSMIYCTLGAMVWLYIHGMETETNNGIDSILTILEEKGNDGLEEMPIPDRHLDAISRFTTSATAYRVPSGSGAVALICYTEGTSRKALLARISSSDFGIHPQDVPMDASHCPGPEEAT